MTDEETFQRGKQLQDAELSRTTTEPTNLGNIIKGQQLITRAAKSGHVMAKERLLYNSHYGQNILKMYEQRFTETKIENALHSARISEIRVNELQSKARKLADVSKLQLASALGNSDALQKIVAFYWERKLLSINVLHTMELDLDVLCGGPDRGKEKNGSYKNSTLQILAERGHKVVGVHKIQLIATETFDIDWLNFSNPIFEKYDIDYGADNQNEAIKWLTFAGKCGFGWAIEKLIAYYYRKQDWAPYIDWQTAKGLTLPDIHKLIGDYYKGCSTPAEMITAVKWYTAANRNFQTPDDMLEAVRWYKLAKRAQDVEYMYMKLGNYYFEIQQWTNAIKYFTVANVPQEDSFRKIGNWYNSQNDPKAWVEALNWLKRANRPQGEIDVVNVKLGDYYFERREWQVAIQYYTDANIPQEDTFKKIGDYLNGLTNNPTAWVEAIKWFKEANRTQLEIDSVNRKLGDWYFANQCWEESLAFYKDASIPELDTMKRIGDYYRDKDDPKEILQALSWYKQANRMQDLDLVNRKVGNYYFEREQWSESIMYYSDGGVPVKDTQKMIGDYYLKKEEPEKIILAVDWYTVANRPEDEIDAVHYRVGSIRLESPHVENWIESVKSFKLAKRPQAFINEVYKKIADHYKACSAPSDWIQAIAYYDLINEKGAVVEIQNRLGNHYFDKGSSMISYKDTKRSNLNEAVKWYRLAADSGHVESQYKLGLCYNNPLIHDAQQSEYWLCLAANSESKEAIDFLYKYHPKTNVALDWVRSRAEAGDGKAQYRMARNYAKGRVVHQDKAKAVEYYRQAYANGSFKAGLSIMFSNMLSSCTCACSLPKKKQVAQGDKSSKSVSTKRSTMFSFRSRGKSNVSTVTPLDPAQSTYPDPRLNARGIPSDIDNYGTSSSVAPDDGVFGPSSLHRSPSLADRRSNDLAQYNMSPMRSQAMILNTSPSYTDRRSSGTAQYNMSPMNSQVISPNTSPSFAHRRSNERLVDSNTAVYDAPTVGSHAIPEESSDEYDMSTEFPGWTPPAEVGESRIDPLPTDLADLADLFRREFLKLHQLEEEKSQAHAEITNWILNFKMTHNVSPTQNDKRNVFDKYLHHYKTGRAIKRCQAEVEKVYLAYKDQYREANGTYNGVDDSLTRFISHDA